jgi:dihydrofolate synthase/folylpolyglutamate synthase
VNTAYADAVKWYYSFARLDPHAPRQDARKLDRMRAILARLDNPHQKFPSIHIAGTKGKGSTAALLESMFRAGGYRTGLYTSPHLHTFRERIRINNQLMPEADVVAYTARLRVLAAHFPDATFFEWVTALAFLYFAEQAVEMAIVETGLGGRLDSTNVLMPRVSVITPISLDHTDILGNSLLKIAREKAGIIKPGAPVVIAPQALRALGEIQRKANKEQVRIINVEKDWRWQLVEATPEQQTVRVRFIKSARWQTFTMPLVGPHQRVNLATALATIDVLHGRNWRISIGSLQQGIANVDWPARFEILARLGLETATETVVETAAETAAAETETVTAETAIAAAETAIAAAADDAQGYVIADGAHNVASVRELVRTLAEVLPHAPAHFIFGASSDKDIAGMLQALAPHAASLTLTQAQTPRAAKIETLVALAQPFNLPLYTAPDVVRAIEQVLERIEPTDTVCVTGSLFMAAEARAYFFDIPNEALTSNSL